MNFLNSFGLSRIDVQKLDDETLLKTYLLLQFCTNHLNRKGNPENENTTTNAGVRFPDVKRKNEELEEAISKNFDELNKISGNVSQERDEEELQKAESFFRKKNKLQELKADPSLHQLSVPSTDIVRGEYTQCLEELTKINEELNREQKRALELNEQLECMKSGDRDH